MDKESKVIILPKTNSSSEFKIINLPNPTNLTTTKSYLLHHNEDSNNQLYELNIIGGEDDTATTMRKLIMAMLAQKIKVKNLNQN